MPTRRRFLRCLSEGLGALALAPAVPARADRTVFGRPSLPDPGHGWRGESAAAATLRSGAVAPQSGAPVTAPGPSSEVLLELYPDLRRHFVFEYYPWYASDPVRHWDQWGRHPPEDIAANCVPRLGAYDSRALRVLETHARWIADSGAGAVNLSWWGPGSFEDAAAHAVLDVMRDHDLKVSFHLEPYADDRSRWFSRDVLYLLREYGEKRGYDALLLLRDARGRVGPVFKSFRTILPREVVDCHGQPFLVPDYTPDPLWRRQTDRVRTLLRSDFDTVTLLADSLDAGRTVEAGFDGIAIYDAFVEPDTYAGYAGIVSARDLVFSFGANPGYDAIEPRAVEPDACYAPSPFLPGGDGFDWTGAEARERAAALSRQRLRDSLTATLAAQLDPGLANVRHGFFLVYLGTFNEWHEGTAVEPMKDRAELTSAERVLGYHNPEQGDYRLSALTSLLGDVLTPEPGTALRVRPG